MPVVWLASYPRSGNTWLRFLLHTYLFGPVESSADLNDRIPDIHRRAIDGAIQPGRLLLAKTHHLWSPAHPHAAATGAFVYVLRHPKDVLLSFLNYRKLGGVIAPDGPEVDRAYAIQFSQHLGDALNIRTGLGSWPQHVAAWLGAPGHPHVIVRYEDLLADPSAQLARVLTLIGSPVDAARLAQAVDACRFSRLRELESTEKSQGRDRKLFPGDAGAMSRGVMFMHEGRSGRTLAHLGNDVETLFDRQFAPFLARLGYGPAAPALGAIDASSAAPAEVPTQPAPGRHGPGCA